MLYSFFVLSGVLLAVFVYLDAIIHKQKMPIMSAVWALTMLWASWFGLVAYLWFGRAKQKKVLISKSTEILNAMDTLDSNREDCMVEISNVEPKRHFWMGVVLSTLHCGAGCTLADIVGEYSAGRLGLSISDGWMLDYGLALIFGLYFQYVAIQQMQKTKPIKAIIRAFKSDVLSLTAWQFGMYGFMTIYFMHFTDGSLSRLSMEFWAVMQVAMLVGFFVAYPINVFLIKIGLKQSM